MLLGYSTIRAPVNSPILSRRRQSVEESGFPLELHPDWSLAPWELNVSSLFGWTRYGKSIYLKPGTPSEPVDLIYKNKYSKDGRISLKVSRDLSAISYSFWAMKLINEDNAIGWRINQGNFELYKLVAGSWVGLFTEASTGFVGSIVDFEINSSQISLRKDGVEIYAGSLDTELDVDGYWGLQSFRFDGTEGEIFTDWKFAPVYTFAVTHNGEIVTHNGEVVTHLT